MNRSRIVLLAMLLLAVPIAILSVAYQHWISRRAMEWWGPEGTAAIADAPHVEAVKLKAVPAKEGATELDKIGPGWLRYVEVERHDVSHVADLAALRHGLLEDPNFRWGVDCDRGPVWQYALEFSGGGKNLTVYFDFELPAIGEAVNSSPLYIAESAAGWRKFFEREFPAPPPR